MQISSVMTSFGVQLKNGKQTNKHPLYFPLSLITDIYIYLYIAKD